MAEWFKEKTIEEKFMEKSLKDFMLPHQIFMIRGIESMKMKNFLNLFDYKVQGILKHVLLDIYKMQKEVKNETIGN